MLTVATGTSSEVEQDIKRSRFIALLCPAASEAAAREVISARRRQFPDARHHCSAFILQSDGATPQMRFSDDGEPNGTAGAPILDALRGAGLTDVVAVVTRYRRTMGLLSGLLAGHSPARWEVSAGPIPHTRLTLLRVDTAIPDLTWFDHVIVVDYPGSLASLDTAVGSAASTGGPSTVQILHLQCQLEERLALLATYRSLRPGASAYPSPTEVEWLLSSPP